ncbi:hypothetical protein NLJ89_g10941 [Agrocybe chaxingu]|uniref:Uncharacterized protein n=1 Tax=Agrocybe chaxingu TaxID=84603 RepID=A0A9W8JQA5_9AGAR|nr:hypothetical protein NLJ89_g10941 [Agrocybe chaxingu]
MRQCLCERCRHSPGIDPVTTLPLQGRYVGDLEYKFHQQLQHATSIASSRLPPSSHPSPGSSAFGTHSRYLGSHPLSSTDFQVPRHKSSLHPGDLVSANPSEKSSLPLSASAPPEGNQDDIYLKRLFEIATTLDRTPISSFSSSEVVFVNPPFRTSRPMTLPNQELLNLVDTVPINHAIVTHNCWLSDAQAFTSQLIDIVQDEVIANLALLVDSQIESHRRDLLVLKMKCWERYRIKVRTISDKVRRVNLGKSSRMHRGEPSLNLLQQVIFPEDLPTLIPLSSHAISSSE